MKTMAYAVVLGSLATCPAWAATPNDKALSAAARAKTSPACRAPETGFWRDQGLAMKLGTKLQFNKPLLRERVDVQVRGGVATLSGGLSAQEKIVAALNIAADVEGIRCIHNGLRVGPPDPATDPGNVSNR